jgi:thiol:disulfide interchange protein
MQDRFKKTDIDFLMRTLVYSLMILALLHAFKPYFGESKAEPSYAEVEAFSQQVKLISPDEVSSYLNESARPTMLVVYASWCGYCRKVMPSIYNLWSQGKINGDQMLLVSIDKTIMDLSKYLLMNDMNSMLSTPIVLKNNGSGLSAALEMHGSGYDGGIPYIGFFAPGGKLITEIPGYIPENQLEFELNNLK